MGNEGFRRDGRQEAAIRVTGGDRGTGNQRRTNSFATSSKLWSAYLLTTRLFAMQHILPSPITKTALFERAQKRKTLTILSLEMKSHLTRLP